MKINNSQLIIADVRTTVVSVPTLRACAWSQGNSRGCTRTVIEVLTEDGLCGLGEAPGARPAELIQRRLRKQLIGRSAFDRGNLRHVLLGSHKDYGSLSDGGLAVAFAGIEIAFWDLLGKRLGIPVYRALGGDARERARFVSYAYAADLAEGHNESEVPTVMAEIARRELGSSGSGYFEFKVGRHSVACDIETVHAVRAVAGPEVGIGVDANMHYTVDQARAFLAGVEGACLSNIEEPVASLAAMEDLRREFGVPISTHCTDPEILRGYPLIDAVVGDFHANGGIEGNLRQAAAMLALGKRYWLRSCIELGIAWAAMCHVAIAAAEIERPSQALINWVEDDLIEGDVWLVRQGGVRPPDAPGLGVSIDRAALERYAAHYQSHGEYTHYDSK